jgi:hypothetical protein
MRLLGRLSSDVRPHMTAVPETLMFHAEDKAELTRLEPENGS